MAHENDYIDNGFQLVNITYQLNEGMSLTTTDQQVLELWLAAHPANQALLNDLLDKRFQGERLKELQAMNIPAFSAQLVAQVSQEAPVTTPVRRLFSPVAKWAVAAAIVLTAGAIYWFSRPAGSPTTPPAIVSIQGASNKATLTLSNGEVVQLDSTGATALANEGGTAIQQANDALVYNNTGTTILTNTLTTPRGGKFRVILPDGTKVWMNSASSLQYPTAFRPGNDRVVTLSGEAYFEVAKHAQMPFRVKVNDLEVKVTGTHFNIHGYSDENVIQTTLLEGGVQVTRNNQLATLTPGLQAVAHLTENTLQTGPANVRQVLSWKDGLFIFDGKQRNEILRELSRWYDIDIEDRSGASAQTYSGIINRNLSLEVLLEVLRESNVLNGRLEGHKLIVLP